MKVRVIGLLGATLWLAGCPRGGEQPTINLYDYVIDAAFVARALGAGYQLVGRADVSDVDPQLGHEAVFVARKGARQELVLARGNHEVITRVRFSGRLQSGPTPGPLALDLWRDRKSSGFLLPLRSSGRGNPVCRVLAWRYVRKTRRLTQAGRFRVPCDPPDKDTTSALDHLELHWAAAAGDPARLLSPLSLSSGRVRSRRGLWGGAGSCLAARRADFDL